MEEKVFFDSPSGARLCGVLSAVASGTEAPIVILVHGLRGSKESRTTTQLSAILSGEGIASFRFDLFGHGESGGRLEDGSLGEFADDILSALSYLKGIGYRIFGIVGVSISGTAAVIAASGSTDLLFMALRSPGMGQKARKMQNYKGDFDSRMWLPAAEKVTIPTLIVHGTADQEVEFEQVKELAEHITGSRLERISGADHNYTQAKDFESMIKLISEFVINNAIDAGRGFRNRG